MIKTVVATIVYIAGIIGLFYLDRAPRTRLSQALWIPTIWFFILATHPLSYWFHIGGQANMELRYEEGNPFDATVFGLLIFAGLVVLVDRLGPLLAVLRNNYAILFYFFYCAVSFAWSDFPFVSFKRWIKAIGDLMMVLILVTDARPVDAVKQLLTRLGFVLLPLSVLFDKYYPNLSRSYSMNWQLIIGGVTDGKNELGGLCLIAGLGSLWVLLDLLQNRETPFRRRRLLARGIILVLAIALCKQADSMTSFSCLLMAGTVMVLSGLRGFRRHGAWIHGLVWGIVALSIFATLLDESGVLVSLLGRNPTLTGRTDIWRAVLSMHTNPLVGAGYEDFWMGSRLIRVGQLTAEGLQEAHNGYIEMYLNLGWIGLILLGTIMATGYPKIIALYRRSSSVGGALLAFFVVIIIYSLTEAGFRSPGLIWAIFLLAVVLGSAGLKRRKRQSAPETAVSRATFSTEAEAGVQGAP
ncbi:MAG: O-antigen ligase family protein [Candidatus Korobacteraceae bacterium]|jgi:O-antigen ligase